MDNVETVKVKSKKRVAYGFKLDFPQTFTLRQLRNLKSRKVSYITIYMRVKKALAAGQIAVVGKQAPKTARKGRQELIYQKVETPATPASAASV